MGPPGAEARCGRYNEAMRKPPEILLLSADADRVRQWSRALVAPDMRLWQGVAALPADELVDVIVTDATADGQLACDSRCGMHLGRGEIGVVRFGPGGRADVRLPLACAASELRLACQLLTEVVRLRRQCNRQRRMHRVLGELAMSDPLTGLPNRRGWQERLTSCSRDPGDSKQLCVAVLDLDHFKMVNEHGGHPAGDQVLQHVGRQLAQAAGEHVFAARLGGDEFGLLIEGLAASMAEEAVERLRVGGCAGSQPAVTASAGAACASPGDTFGCETLFRTADAALWRAKAQGRNCTVWGSTEASA